MTDARLFRLLWLSIGAAVATITLKVLSVDVVAALLLAFLSSTALWWLYFGQVASTVLERIRAATADERGQIGRDIYTYLHLPSIAGIFLVAVGDELVIAHPMDDLHDAGTLVALGGPAAASSPALPGSVRHKPAAGRGRRGTARRRAARRRRRRAGRVGAAHRAPGRARGGTAAPRA